MSDGALNKDSVSGLDMRQTGRLRNGECGLRSQSILFKHEVELGGLNVKSLTISNIFLTNSGQPKL